MWTTPSGDSLFNDHPFGTFDAWSGRRPPHHLRQFDSLATTTALPLETGIATAASGRIGKFAEVNAVIAMDFTPADY